MLGEDKLNKKNTSFAAIQNNGGDISNTECAEIILFKNMINNDNGSNLTSVINQGLIRIDSDENSVIGYGINEGVIADVQGTVLTVEVAIEYPAITQASVAVQKAT